MVNYTAFKRLYDRAHKHTLCFLVHYINSHKTIRMRLTINYKFEVFMDTAGGVIEAFNAPLLPLMGADTQRTQ